MKQDVIKSIFEKYKYFIIVILLGICLMIITPAEKVIIEEETLFNEQNDLDKTTKELQEILSQIDGVGRVSVMLTLSESSENIYAVNQTISENSDKSEVVIVSKSGENTPITVKNIYPKYSGALVVCDGANQSSVNLTILEAIKSLLGISSNQITITKMTN